MIFYSLFTFFSPISSTGNIHMLNPRKAKYTSMYMMKQLQKARKTLNKLFSIGFLFLFLMPYVNAQTVTTNTQSTHNGFFYSFWNDGSKGSASMTLGAAGNYSTTWSNIGNFTAGKGWAVGKADRVVCFSGNFNGGSNGFLALYGWTKNALIEYYVCENHGSWTPPGNTSDIQKKGTYTSDGGTYTIYTATRTNQPSIVGNATFQQFWSVRTEKRSSGTITFANHVAAWKAAGLNMGTTWDYQIMESEGYNSSGSSNITVSECVSCATPAPITTLNFDYELGAAATQLTATGTAVKWYTVSTGGTALASAPTPNTNTSGTTKYYVGQTLNGCEGPRAEVTIRVTQKYKIFKVSAPITIDGAIEASWTNASVLPAATTKLLTGTITNAADLSGNFKALWDDTYLYVLADVTDEKLINESTAVYDDDAVEVYVDINNDKASAYGTNDVQYSFGWNDGTTVGVLPAGRSTTNITYKAVAKTGGYIVEARIPWATLQGTPAVGQLVGMDFMINDDDDNGARDSKLSWNADADDAWEDPSLFGTAVLQGLLPCTTPAAPTVISTISYCQNASATALTATGVSLLWYTGATGGTGSATALVPVTGTVGTVNYYVTQNVSGCESSRAAIAVTVTAAPSAPMVTSTISYCQNATASALSATGNGLKWYDVAVNGTALVNAPTPSTATVGTTNYYVSQSTGSCESSRAAVAVTVTAAPAAPTVVSAVTYCQNATASVLSATGNGLKWYDAAVNATALANAPTPLTTATGTKNYYVSQAAGSCESSRAIIAVTVTAAPSAPAVVSPVSYCQNAAASALSATGNGLKWYDVASNGTALANAPTPSTATVGTTNYYVSQSTGSCESARAQISVTVHALPSAIIMAGSATTFCVGGSVTLTASTGTSYLWKNGSNQVGTVSTYSALSAGSYTVEVTNINNCKATSAATVVTVNAAPSAPTVVSAVSYCQNAAASALSATGNGLKWYDVAVNGSALANTPTPSTATVGTTNYYVSQSTGSCESARAQIAVTVHALPSAIIAAGSATTFCVGGSVTLTASTGTSYLWKNGSNQVGTASTYSALSAGSYTVEVTNINNCKATSAATVVTVNAAPSAPTVVSAVSYCQNAAASALSATGNGLKWYDVAVNGTVLANTPTPSTATVGTTNYYISQSTGSCESARAQIAVTVYALPSAIITAGSATTFCTGGSVTLTASTGTSYLWKNGSNQVGTASTYSALSAGSYTVEVTNINNCKATSAATVVTVNAAPSAPTVVSAVSYCQNAAASVLSATGNGLKWYDVASNGTALANTPTPSTTVSGTTNYYVSQTTGGCESSRAAIAVTVNALPAATITVSGSAVLISGQTVTLNANIGTGLTYKWFKGTEQVGTGASYTTGDAGNYMVEVINSNTCSATSAITSISTAQNQPSTITITSITDNATVHSPVTITVNVTDPDGAIVLVEFLDGDKVIGKSTTQPYSFIWTNPADGSHTITVRATDALGGVTTSTPITITTSTATGVHSSRNNVYGLVYPIPATAEITVETQFDLTDAVFKITNILGEEMLLPIMIQGAQAKINVTELSEGTYILMITNQSNVLTKKIIKSN